MKEVLASQVTTIDVAVPLPVQGLFTYTVPSELISKAKRGVRVRVPFKNREIVCYLISVASRESTNKLKPILEVLDDEPVLSEIILKITQWIASYYGGSWGEAIENALPKWVKYGKKATNYLKKKEGSEEKFTTSKSDKILTKPQKAAFEKIKIAIQSDHPKPLLLYGVTGSGKSELYIRAIEEVLEKGQSAICLVPEIALTEQLRHFFIDHFGDQLEILHSRLSDGERFLAWKRLETGVSRVVLGPRSAIFAPCPNLGLVILDEEHESTYKQETTPRYHAREVAKFRAREENALLILGSATPSLESRYLAKKDKIDLIKLSERIHGRLMPKVSIVNLRDYQAGGSKRILLSKPLLTQIQKNLESKEGTLLLLNRRGFSTHIQCPQCGQTEECAHCHVALTFHQEDHHLLCHYCNYQKTPPKACSNCESDLLRFQGFGTEKIESEVAKLFPFARIGRLDADTVRRKGSHENILADFRAQKLDILIGTQMIAKGFDFAHVTLVGVVLADIGLALPDFRSAERTFQLLTQVSGRAGRGEKPGRVLIQTLNPNHPSIRCATKHDYDQFFDQEINSRYTYNYPPYTKLVNIIIRSREEKKAYLFSREVHEKLEQFLNPSTARDLSLFDPAPEPPKASLRRDNTELLGPSPLPFYKLRGHFRWHVLLKTKVHPLPSSEIIGLLGKIKKPSAVQLAIDIEPLSIL